MQILRTPDDILIEFLKTWDRLAQEEADKNPFFKKVWDSAAAIRQPGRPGEAVHVRALQLHGRLLLAAEDELGRSQRNGEGRIPIRPSAPPL